MITVTQSPTLNETGQVGTQEWLEATKGLIIVAYVGATAAVPADDADEAPRFGTHLKETIDAFKYFFGPKI
jgi:hypothetical protein